ncbi:hypothetical protein IGI04_020549 [Brassica rapa subsp. trilocularis]|uniref:Uncharacterized protein n=1 Tax=Brassica rapa subsp. trilocularis TaxID=1813537 RepID=A0ABQ7MJV8_BRACM|nr:hypothetical protein IGI04_020549 [Brassica rapa subsp. trilocularis]
MFTFDPIQADLATAETREVCSSSDDSSSSSPIKLSTIHCYRNPLLLFNSDLMVSSTFPSISFYIKPTLIETMQKQLHLQAWKSTGMSPLSTGRTQGLLLVACAVTVVAWLVSGHWVLNNLLGISIFIAFVSHVRLPNIKICAMLLLCLFVYDIFWVLFSERFFGANVMVTVATQQASNPVHTVANSLNLPGLELITKKLELPVKIVFPRNLLGGVEPGVSASEFMMLGLGDMVALYVGGLYIYWMGICNENGTRHTRTVKDEEDSLKRKVKETMEKAFWDSVMESMKLEEPGMSFARWCLLLNSGTLDIDYLGKMLEFALATLRKLSAPANDRENESTHQSLLEELHRLCQAKDESGSLHAVAIVKGNRFILEQIHV